MPAKNLSCLLHYLEQQGECFLGQVRISGHYVLSHREDADLAAAQVFRDPHDAIEIARHDDEGRFRPLKTAPNLRRGWRLELNTTEQILMALDFLYPAVIGATRQFESGELEAVPLRRTLERQSGMYTVVKKISAEQAQELIAKTCSPQNGCLKKILWPIDQDDSSPLRVGPSGIFLRTPEIPMLCAEACNLLVAAGRKVVKTR